MNPHQRNKVDIGSMTPDEQRLFRLYGKLPNRNDLLQKKFQERKYFDSGDYALTKAGKASDAGVTSVGSQHPNPENIPHLASPVPNGSNAPGGNGNALPVGHPGTSVSPVKESRFKTEDADKPVEEQGKLVPNDGQTEIASGSAT